MYHKFYTIFNIASDIPIGTNGAPLLTN